MLGLHIAQDACLLFEVIARRMEDRGGGLARVNGKSGWWKAWRCRARRTEFRLRITTRMTWWIDIDRLLAVFGLSAPA